ncbi:MAG TPA: argininosuccinate lyase, partial [Gemmatimonadales bacterium]|nr:argininosuccinate lyase [Gemmatimonadales bacterium]
GAKAPARRETLWSRDASIDSAMLEYTVGNDRETDRALLAWDVLGSLGHVEGLRASRLITGTDHRKLRAGLRSAFRAVRSGRLVIGPEHEDAHSAVELWLTRRVGAAGERLHTGRSRNDQVAADLRLFLKDSLLALQVSTLATVAALLLLAERNRDALWPGFTHTRRAMPSSAGLWAAAFAEGLLDTVEALPSLWARVDRSPLGSAAGYGVPLPLDRLAAARALGFSAVEHNVATVQNGRGKLEADALFWCVQIGHELSRLSTDVILYSGEEYALLRLPARLATGSSIMPHKRNPDLFELTRGRVAGLEGDLATVLSLRGKLGSGYHRDFQLLKEPLFRGIESTERMLAVMAGAIPQLEVNRAHGLEALAGGALVTDEVMRRVESGTPFRRAYREVAAAIKRGETFPSPTPARIIARRRSHGGLGRLELNAAWRRFALARRWSEREMRRFYSAMDRLRGPRAR